MLVYRLFILLYPKIVWLLGFTNPKAKLWLSGKKRYIQKTGRGFSQKQQARYLDALRIIR
jgi:hypothetical protein